MAAVATPHITAPVGPLFPFRSLRSIYTRKEEPIDEKQQLDDVRLMPATMEHHDSTRIIYRHLRLGIHREVAYPAQEADCRDGRSS